MTALLLLAGSSWPLRLTVDCVGLEDLAMGRTRPSEATGACLALQMFCLRVPGWQSFLDVWSHFPAGGLLEVGPVFNLNPFSLLFQKKKGVRSENENLKMREKTMTKWITYFEKFLL